MLNGADTDPIEICVSSLQYLTKPISITSLCLPETKRMSEFRIHNQMWLMLHTTRRQVYFSATVILLATGFYTSIYIQPYLHVLLVHQPNFENVSSGLGYPESNLAISLTPQDHVQRQPRTIHLVWNITSDLRAPDGVTKRVYLINGP